MVVDTQGLVGDNSLMTLHIPERRSGKERRSGRDRRVKKRISKQ